MRFYSKVPGSKYVFPDGTTVIFAHGFLDITKEAFPGVVTSPNPQFKLADDGKERYLAYKEELTRLVNEGNPLIFTQDTVKKLQQVGDEYKQDATKSAKSEAEIAQSDSKLRQVGGHETGDLNRGSPGGQDTNTSTVDPNLQKEVLAPRTGNSKVDQLRAEAAARQSVSKGNV